MEKKKILSAEGQELLIAPNSPSAGVTVAFVIDNGTPIEFLQLHPTEDSESGA